MKKIIATIMVAMAALIAAPAMAQTQSTTAQEQTCQQKDKKCKGKKRCDRKGKKGKRGCRKASASPAFKGVEMTAEQQSQVDTIYSQAAHKCRVTCTQAKEAMAKEVDMRVKEVLTPDQYGVYEANKVKMQERKKAKCPGQGCKEAEKKGSK